MKRLTLICAFVFIVLVSTASAQIDWPLLDTTLHATSSSYEPIVDIVEDPTNANNLFVADQSGVIHLIEDGTYRNEAVISLSLTYNGHEEGLLGIEFSPDYPNTPTIYVFTAVFSSAPVQRVSKISRFTLDPVTRIAAPESEEIILQFTRANASHNGGQIRFGPDGYLYISVGDNGSPGHISSNAQDLTNFHGKILRIDPEGAPEGVPYLVPASNPPVANAGDQAEIIAWGLRNPWRFTFHPTTNDMFIGDVGENDREEINIFPDESFSSGANFGWPYKEGTLDVAGQTNPRKTLTPPIHEYARGSYGSVIGGEFFQATGEPPLYLFGDISGGVYALAENQSGEWEARLALNTDFRPYCFGITSNGSVYMGDSWTREIHTIDETAVLLPPVFSTQEGTYTGPRGFAVSSPQPLATLRYTLDGTNPTNESTAVSSGYVLLNEPATIKVAAFHSNLTPSEVTSATYGLKVASVYRNPSGILRDYTQVALSTTTPIATIRYTTDGSLVTEDSPVFDPSNPPADLFITDNDTQIRAQAFRDGWTPGPMLNEYVNLWIASPQIAGFSSSNTYSHLPLYAPVRPESTTSNVTYRYTTDGSQVTETSDILPENFYINDQSSLKIGAFKEGMSLGETTLYYFGIDYQRGTQHRLTPNSSSSNTTIEGPTESTPLDDPIHVALDASGLLFVAENIYSPALWKLEGGISSKLFQGVHGDRFDQIVVADNGDLIARGSTTFGSSLRVFHSPDFTSNSSMTLGVNTSTIFPESSDYLIVGSNPASTNLTKHIYRAKSGESPQLITTEDDTILAVASKDSSVYYTTSKGQLIRYDGNREVIAGSGVYSSNDGDAMTASFASPFQMIGDDIGNWYIVDNTPRPDGIIRKVTPDGKVTTLYGALVDLDGNIENEATFPIAGGSIAVDSDGVIYGANGGFVWKFIQADWDNDGIPDDAERAYGSPYEVGVDDRNVDTDIDGFSNAAEFFTGNPLVQAIKPRQDSLSLQFLGKESAVLMIAGNIGEEYQIEYSEDLTNWFPIGPPRTMTTAGMVQQINLLEDWTTKRFFRARELTSD